MNDETIERQDWPLLPWVLAGILGLSGFMIWLVGGEDGPGTRDGLAAAAGAFFFFGGIALAFTIDRDRWKEPVAFSALVGLVMAGLAWRTVGGSESIAAPEYGFLAGVIATGLALPLFQAGFHRSRWRTPYRAVHDNVWTDAICFAGSMAFLGASWLLLVLLSELFRLLKIDLLRDLMDQAWFGWTWSGAAFGAALGVLRNESGILGTLKRVVMTVLSILAVPLAAGLALFLVAMIVSGPDVLWQATRNATPILLLCAAGAWVLANAIVRDSDSEMSGNRLLRGAALLLVVIVLPLTVFAAVSLGTRIAQHGLSPERLWGITAIAVATAYGLAWFVAVIRSWRGDAWRENVRRANLHLAVAISGIALLLALPILDFGAISARQQVARLESGKVSADDFDYAALRWDFGNAGRKALARLAETGGKAGEMATLARKQTERIYSFDRDNQFRTEAEIDVRVIPEADAALRKLVVDHLRSHAYLCPEFCIALDLGPHKDGGREVAFVMNGRYQRVALPQGTLEPTTEVAPAGARAFGRDTRVEVQSIEKRYIVVDGRPIGPPLD
ncbi:hypothetical protein A6F68_01424 [Tsuneonella dongtanensis]|uniref:DUF4153 domain-containing protein n=1 Tax=Tsuneonella dongtanensis TaxID=692370 RepID=A0A1B2ACQ6_9SPHN|nr:DUF4153 domain-containing protein [Tsuneonella dongtanensis]ANY19940.1 hypothetical protein A6F68_01424 [Tsuneonella dongtanensis]